MTSGSAKPGGLAQRLDLRLPQAAPVALLEPAEAERPVGGPLKVADGMADGLQHPTDLAVAALVQHHPELGPAARVPQHLDLRRSGAAVVQLDTRAERPEVVLAGRAVDRSQAL